MPKTRKRRQKTTKYGEPIRRFNGKKFRLKNEYGDKQLTKKEQKRMKKWGYLTRTTKVKGGYRLWIRDTPKSRKSDKKVFR